jgi:molecular chaperone DnaK (HSP70)
VTVPSAAKYIVGIDLGTTHTVVAYAEPGQSAQVFGIPQLVTSSEIGRRPLLASALYAPVAGESVADPWQEAPFVVGEFARHRGSAVPGRFVASAKSWLSHLGVDRNAPILPWGAEADDIARISPVDASAMYLRHVQLAWNEAFPGHALAAQDVILTVPASFDQSARELTLEAAGRAGLQVRVLEEPQAAFYDFMHADRSLLSQQMVSAGEEEMTVLVCDVGGGTTDLSLMRIGAERCSRTAVGRHLLLGGDNMDLALAHLCEPRISSERLDPASFGQLVLSCRTAKEVLLGQGGPAHYPVTVVAKGAALVGKTRSTLLSRDEALELVLSGFFPAIAFDSIHDRPRGALMGFGLPYERDTAITRHVASFLRRHASNGPPRALLLNGGVFHARPVADRLRDVIQSWSDAPIDVLPHRDPDLAVARGAVAYGQALRGRGPRIESSSARGYYIGLASGAAAEPRRLVSIVPRGAREAEVHRIVGRTFALTVGRPARFDLFASDDDRVDTEGAVVRLEEDRFLQMPPVIVELGAGDGPDAREVMVELAGELTPVGTLDLACVEVATPEKKRHRLAFEIRSKPHGAVTSSRLPGSLRSLPPGTQRRAEASAAIEQVFGKGRSDVKPRMVKDLVRELERVLGERATWNLDLARSLFDETIQSSAARRRSPDHERIFWMLAGYTLRPGFGDPSDAARAHELARLFEGMLTHQGEARGWQQFWIAWRRAAGGLSETWQTRIRDEIDPFLAPPELRLKKRKGLRPQALDALLETASSLERVSPMRKAELGAWILERTWTDRDHRLFVAIGRLGARVPSYASVHHVVAPSVVERWVDHLLREKWDELPAAADAAVQLTRVTGDRARDLSEAIRAEVEKKLTRVGAAASQVRAVCEVVPIEEADRARFFGESLPVGIRLVG